MTLDEMLANGELERVEPDQDASHVALEEARRHVASARAIAATDPNGAYQLAYDAARKQSSLTCDASECEFGVAKGRTL